MYVCIATDNCSRNIAQDGNLVVDHLRTVFTPNLCNGATYLPNVLPAVPPSLLNFEIYRKKLLEITQSVTECFLSAFNNN